MVWEAAVLECSASRYCRPPDYIKGQIGGFVLHKGAVLTVSVR